MLGLRARFLTAHKRGSSACPARRARRLPRAVCARKRGGLNMPDARPDAVPLRPDRLSAEGRAGVLFREAARFRAAQSSASGRRSGTPCLFASAKDGCSPACGGLPGARPAPTFGAWRDMPLSAGVPAVLVEAARGFRVGVQMFADIRRRGKRCFFCTRRRPPFHHLHLV